MSIIHSDFTPIKRNIESNEFYQSPNRIDKLSTTSILISSSVSDNPTITSDVFGTRSYISTPNAEKRSKLMEMYNIKKLNNHQDEKILKKTDGNIKTNIEGVSTQKTNDKMIFDTQSSEKTDVTSKDSNETVKKLTSLSRTPLEEEEDELSIGIKKLNIEPHDEWEPNMLEYSKAKTVRKSQLSHIR